MDLEPDAIDREDGPMGSFTSPTRRALDPGPETVIDPPAEADRVPTIPLDLLVRSFAVAIEELLTHEDAPLAILQRLCAQAVLDAPLSAHGDACELLRSSLALRGIDTEPAAVVRQLVSIGGGAA
jgi:hypothetical protein